MTDQTFTLDSEVDGLPLTGYVWKAQPADTARGLVVVAHGMAEHAKRYVTFARSLNEAGYMVVAHDHRGHGASPGPNGLGDFGKAGWDALVKDLAQVVRFAKSQFSGLDTVLFGHSMGSFATQQFLLSDGELLDRVVLSGSAATDKLFAALAKARSESSDSGLNIHNRGFTHRTGYEWLSRDEEQVDRYVSDPLCGFELTTESIMGLIAQAATLADLNNLKNIPTNLPVLLLAGSDDPVTGQLAFLETLYKRYKQVGISQVDTLYYQGGRHEMLNEINRQQVVADVIAWLDS
ncbi:alpha/beta hydrolase [Aurantivibrio plasticivorans]